MAHQPLFFGGVRTRPIYIIHYTGGSITATKEKRMTRIIVDSDLLIKLLNLSQPLEFCTKSGFVLGTFTPLPERESVLRAEPYVSEEELDQRAQGPGFSTDEVVTYLESL
jgi:hypothetical protein